MLFCGGKFDACPVVRDALKVINENCFRDKTDDKILPRIYASRNKILSH